MPTTIEEGHLTFAFPDEWRASKYDKWTFYRNQFEKQIQGIKAIDILAVSDEPMAFFIEIKDYRHPDTEEILPSELAEAITGKVLMTLAAMLPATIHGTDETERRFAEYLLQCRKIRVVAHVELPLKHIPPVDIADLKQKLRRLLRAVDPHVKVVSTQNMRHLEWTVTLQ